MRRLGGSCADDEWDFTLGCLFVRLVYGLAVKPKNRPPSGADGAMPVETQKGGDNRVNITLPTQETKRALDFVCTMAPSRYIHRFVQVEPLPAWKRLSFAVSDGNYYARALLPCDDEDSLLFDPISLPLSLRDILSLITEEEIRLLKEEDEGIVRLIAGRGKYNIPLLSEEPLVFPTEAETLTINVVTVELPVSEIKGALDQAIKFLPKTKYMSFNVLSGIHFNFHDGAVDIVSSDERILYRRRLEVNVPSPVSVTLPTQVKLMLGYLAHNTNILYMTVSMSEEDKAQGVILMDAKNIENTSFQVILPAFADKYPPYGQIAVPLAAPSLSLVVDNRETIKVVRRLINASKAQAPYQTQLATCIRFWIEEEEGNLLRMQATETFERRLIGEDAVDCSLQQGFVSKDNPIVVNATYFDQMLGVFPGETHLSLLAYQKPDAEGRQAWSFLRAMASGVNEVVALATVRE